MASDGTPIVASGAMDSAQPRPAAGPLQALLLQEHARADGPQSEAYHSAGSAASEPPQGDAQSQGSGQQLCHPRPSPQHAPAAAADGAAGSALPQAQRPAHLAAPEVPFLGGSVEQSPRQQQQQQQQQQQHILLGLLPAATLAQQPGTDAAAAPPGTEAAEQAASKKRGRPKGSRNRKTLEREGLLLPLEAQPPKKRGRPPGSRNRKTIEREQALLAGQQQLTEQQAQQLAEQQAQQLAEQQELAAQHKLQLAQLQQHGLACAHAGPQAQLPLMLAATLPGAALSCSMTGLLTGQPSQPQKAEPLGPCGPAMLPRSPGPPGGGKVPGRKPGRPLGSKTVNKRSKEERGAAAQARANGTGKRRGRPPGSKNRPKPSAAAAGGAAAGGLAMLGSAGALGGAAAGQGVLHEGLVAAAAAQLAAEEPQPGSFSAQMADITAADAAAAPAQPASGQPAGGPPAQPAPPHQPPVEGLQQRQPATAGGPPAGPQQQHCGDGAAGLSGSEPQLSDE